MPFSMKNFIAQVQAEAVAMRLDPLCVRNAALSAAKACKVDLGSLLHTAEEVAHIVKAAAPVVGAVASVVASVPGAGAIATSVAGAAPVAAVVASAVDAEAHVVEDAAPQAQALRPQG